MTQQQPEDAWADGALYEPFVGRWSRLVARSFLRWLALPVDLEWLDVGCGTGALCETILERCRPRRLHGIEPSEAFLAFAQNQITDPRVTFQQGSAEALPCKDDEFDIAVSALVLNFVPDPEHAIKELIRVVRPGGVVALYVWDYAGDMQMLRHFWDAAIEINPQAREFDEGVRFPICQPHALADLLVRSGLDKVEPRAIDVPTVFDSFDDFWTPFLSGQGPAPSYVASLSESEREEVRDELAARLPGSGSGQISLIARAWAVRGIVGS